MVFLAVCGLDSWQYQYHLGIYGIYSLFQSMVRSAGHQFPDVRLKTRHPIFIVGELPEELLSYRHMVARLLNLTKENVKRSKGRGPSGKKVHAFTGDIGLHVDLGKWLGGATGDQPTDGATPAAFEPKIRCAFCNFNNELVCKGESYHTPDLILETPIKRRDASMIYLCTKRDHHPQTKEHPRHFLSRTEVRTI